MIINPNYASLQHLPAYKEPSSLPLQSRKCVWVAPGCSPPLLMLVGCREHRAPAQVFLSRPRRGHRGGESPAPALPAEGLCPVSPARWRSQRGACSLQTWESSFPQPCPALWLRDHKLVLLVPSHKGHWRWKVSARRARIFLSVLFAPVCQALRTGCDHGTLLSTMYFIIHLQDKLLFELLAFTSHRPGVQGDRW